MFLFSILLKFYLLMFSVDGIMLAVKLLECFSCFNLVILCFYYVLTNICVFSFCSRSSGDVIGLSYLRVCYFKIEYNLLLLLSIDVCSAFK